LNSLNKHLKKVLHPKFNFSGILCREKNSNPNNKRIATLFIVATIIIFSSNTAEARGLRELALDFLQRINPVYEEKKTFSPLDQIPEGGTLLLRPRSEKVFLEQDIFAKKIGNEIYIELTDFINILEFPIDFNDDTLIGEGWFLREDWQITFNLADGFVQSKGSNYNIAAGDVVEDNGLYFVRTSILQDWFSLILEIDPAQQILDIESPFPFPFIAKQQRESSFAGRKKRQRAIATLPRHKQERSNFDINTADVSLSNRVQKTQFNDEVSNRQFATVISQGEVLGHNAEVFANFDDTDYLRNVRTKIFRESENADLLGGLKARRYAFGDIDEVRVPLVSESNQNLGFRFTNSTLKNTDFATTDIEGQAFPGWDVQLYRNGVLIDSQIIESDGRYVFDEVQLFAGDNDFELFFFGPQGEIRAQNVSVPVSQALLSSQDDTYEFSIALEDSQTYRKNFTSEEDTDTVNVTARYNKLIGDNHLAYFGFRSRKILGERKLFLSTGATSTIGATLLDTNFAVDEEGNAATQAIIRRNFLGWNTSLRGTYNSQDFNIEESENTIQYAASFNAQRAFDMTGFKGSLLLNSLYQKTIDDDVFKTASLGFSTNLLGASLSNKLVYEDNEISDIEGDDETWNYTASIRKNFGRFFLNLTSNYEIQPESELERLRAQLNYRHNNDLSTSFTYDKSFENEVETFQFNVNYLHDKFRLSPFIQYNSDEEFFAGINLNFSLYDDPSSPFPAMTSERLNGRGAVQAFVYHDINGNHIFDEGDEPLPDTAIQSVQSSRLVLTNEEGYAIIPNLAKSRATDIEIRNDGLEDPFMIPSLEGRSIYPMPGTIHRLEFPVELTGEIEGVVSLYEDKPIDLMDGDVESNQIDSSEPLKQPAGFQTIQLIPLSDPNQSPVSGRAERDGYYVMFMIPPGDYLLMTEASPRIGNAPPRIITIGRDAPIINDLDIALYKNRAYVPYEVVFNRATEIPAGFSQYQPTLRVKKAGQSDLSKTVYNIINKQTDEIYEGLVKVKSLSLEDGEFDYYIAVETQNFGEFDYLHEKCRRIQDNLGECSVIINSTLLEATANK
jgi:hypothetical protein